MVGAAVNLLSVHLTPPTKSSISQSDVMPFSLGKLNAEMDMFRNNTAAFWVEGLPGHLH